MTAGNNRSSRKSLRHSDPVSDAEPDQTPDKVDDESSSDETRSGRKRPRDDHPLLARLVSHDAQYISENDEDSLGDKKEKPSMLDPQEKMEPQVPPQPNPLYNSKLLQAHINSLRLEADLFPMRQQVARLMAHPTHNRRGLFNSPVDPVALGLIDYEKIITKPRDLGTIKAKLHAVAYNNREEVADDIRLVFTNAMTYNPPTNAVHIAAKHLLQAFEEAYQVLKATANPVALSVSNQMNPQSWTCLPATASSPPHAVVRSVSMMDMIKTTGVGPVAGIASRTESVISHDSCCTTVSLKKTIDESNFEEKTVLASTHLSEHCNVPFFTQEPPTRPVSLNTPPTNAAHCVAPNETKCSLRGSVSTVKNPFAALPQAEKALKRAMNVAAKHAKHSCRSCLGRNCSICEQGCLSHEPALLICTGSNCMGARIRKGAVYYIAKDGSRQFCQRCYTNLQAVLPHTADQIDSFGSSVRYKRDLLKRKNEEDVAEPWLTCKSCNNGVHKICSMYNEFVHSSEDYECPSCVTQINDLRSSNEMENTRKVDSDYFTYLSGSEIPVELDRLTNSQAMLSAETLPETQVSSFIQQRVRDCIAATNVPNAEKTVTVRVISDCSKNFKVPEVVRKHFRQPARDATEDGTVPPARVNYKSKAITLFQKIDGLDVCIFCMYVQEYDCKDDFDGQTEGEQKKRVYIAYLDSVEHFRPRSCRTEVFREILVAYLATARARGYESAHIWACPPSRGNSFVFWNHPASQRTPTKERLIAWYHGVLNRCIESGVITDVQSLFESSFPLATVVRTSDATVALSPENMTVEEDGVLGGRMACPPLMDGDFWIEEAVRLHAANMVRFLKSKPNQRDPNPPDERCPAVQVASLIRDRILAQPASAPFRRPVNAVSLQLNDYHKVISKPMDLGTVYSRCILGEFDILQDVVDDVELVFSNAMRYNPRGHAVHDLAIDVRAMFFKELDALAEQWRINGNTCVASAHSWKAYANTSMSLDHLFEEPTGSDSTTSMPPSPRNKVVSLQSQVIRPHGVIQLKIQLPDSPPPQAEVPSPLSLCCSSNDCSLVSNTVPKYGTSPVSAKRTSKALFTLLNSKLELLTGGEDAILQRMVGNDVWIVDKKGPTTPKSVGPGKKKSANKRRKCASENSLSDEPAAKRRRQSWLGEEVGLSVRKMRTSFFSCSLVPKGNMSVDELSKENEFKNYIAPFVNSNAPDYSLAPSRIADARHALLEFSQYRNLEFDTLRRAKYSTSVLLYHLHHDDAPGLIPTCSSCLETIQEIRWHRIRRVEERHHTGRVPPTLRAAKMAQIGVNPDVAEACHRGEELCASCYETRVTKEEFIPLPVSFKA